MKEGFYQYISDQEKGTLQNCHVFKSAGGKYMLVDYNESLTCPNSAAGPCSRARFKTLIPLKT